MDDMNNKYPDYFDEYFDDDTQTSNPRRNRNNSTRKNNSSKNNSSYKSFYKNGNGRKGLKWVLLALLNQKYLMAFIALGIIAIIITSIISCNTNTQPIEPTEPTVQATTVASNSYQIKGIPVMFQDEYKACCESYACTMLMQYLGFDLEIGEFVNNYLLVKPLEYGEDGNLYGPDLDAAFAGDLQFGCGVNSPAMAKFMNNYLKDQNSNLKATSIKGTSLEEFCKNYVSKDIPVMIWATANLQEPFVQKSWIINYTDENSTKKIGDSMEWLMHEHCMVLMGYDEDNYYMNDSVEGKVSVFEKKAFEDLYEKLGSQAIVVQ